MEPPITIYSMETNSPNNRPGICIKNNIFFLLNPALAILSITTEAQSKSGTPRSPKSLRPDLQSDEVENGNLLRCIARSGLGEVAIPRGNSVLPRRFGLLRFALACVVYQKFTVAAELSRPLSPAGLRFCPPESGCAS